MTAVVAMVLGLACTGLLATVVTQRRTALPDHADRGLRHDRAWHAVGLGAALLAAALAGLWAMDAPWRGELGIPLFMALAAGVGYVAAQTAGQLLWPQPGGEHRRADLTPRGPADVVGPRTRRMVAAVVVVFAGAVALPALIAPLDGPTAGPQDIYRAAWSDPPSAVNTVRVVLGLGWPGLRYGVPAVLAAGVLLLLTWLCIRAVADRSRIADTAADVDAVLRRAAARRVLAAAGGTLAFAGGWFALATGSRLVEVGTAWGVPTGLVLLVLGGVWAAAGLVTAVVGVLWPVRLRRRGPSAERVPG